VAHVCHLVVDHTLVRGGVLVFGDAGLHRHARRVRQLRPLVTESLSQSIGSLLGPDEVDPQRRACLIRYGPVGSSVEVVDLWPWLARYNRLVIDVVARIVLVGRGVEDASSVLVLGHGGDRRDDLVEGSRGRHLNQQPVDHARAVRGAEDGDIVHIGLLDFSDLSDDLLDVVGVGGLGLLLHDVPLPLIPLSSHNDRVLQEFAEPVGHGLTTAAVEVDYNRQLGRGGGWH